MPPPSSAKDKPKPRGLLLPEVFTVRLLVMSVVALLAVVLLVPTARARIDQMMTINQARSQLAAQEVEAEHLRVELERWDDPAFVAAQARERLGFVNPGDTVWRIRGGDVLLEDVDPVTGLPVEAGIVGTLDGESRPWYESIWESMRVADGPRPDADADADSTPDTPGQ